VIFQTDYDEIEFKKIGYDVISVMLSYMTSSAKIDFCQNKVIF